MAYRKPNRVYARAARGKPWDWGPIVARFGIRFDYTVEQRARIETELRQAYRKAFKKEISDADLENSLIKLKNIALEFLFSGRGRTAKEFKVWAGIERSLERAIEKLATVDNLKRDRYRPLFAVKDYAAIAKRPKVLRKITPRAIFQLRVLEVWTDYLGLKPGLSRTKGKVTGPLARYFSAATQPVYAAASRHHASLESLAAIWRRRQMLKATEQKSIDELFDNWARNFEARNPL
jgi:hypothetical protein